MPQLRIFLFGVGRVVRGHDDEVAVPPSVRSMLGYLVLNRDRPHHRDVLANTFWPDVDDKCARNRLSSALWRLRDTLEPDGVAEGTYLVAPRHGSVSFNVRSDHWLDVVEFERGATAMVAGPIEDVERADVERFATSSALYRSELLEGTDLPWLLYERERLAHLFLLASTRALVWHELAGETETAIGFGKRILDHDPLREDVHRTLIRLYGKLGRRGLAREQFDQCRTILRTELGVTPLAETVAVTAAVVEALDGPHAISAPPAIDPATPARGQDGDGRPDSDHHRDLAARLEQAARTLELVGEELVRVSRSLREFRSAPVTARDDAVT
jgi:DNA-binding SARP family transcriptional activator